MYPNWNLDGDDRKWDSEYYEFDTDYLVDLLGKDLVAALDEDRSLEAVKKLILDADMIRMNLGAEGARGEAAKKLIERLVPPMIDVALWRDVALGKNVHLPVGDQYGWNSERIHPSDAKVKKPARGNAYGKVHSKGQQAPADFMKRQGQAMKKALADIGRLEQELKRAREHRDEIQAGLKLYAFTCLLTEMRKAVAPVFAMGPAWTLLRAISGTTGREIAEEDAQLETHRILVVLHALREHQQFEQELKGAIHEVCVRYGGEARRRGKPLTEFDGPYEYEEIMKGLKWPTWPPDDGIEHLKDIPFD
ncbi:MAG: hypothetical protein Q7T60_15295 [Sphingopyxis sp.]|nr:hypothetical protein [Sphingopyxis sp.]